MKLTPEVKARIDGMTRYQLCSNYRFAAVGDPLWEGESGGYMMTRLRELGGFSPEISKELGWNHE